MNLQSAQVIDFSRKSHLYLIFDAQYSSNKGFAEDLTEGKFSFPIVHGIFADTSNSRILSKWDHGYRKYNDYIRML